MRQRAACRQAGQSSSGRSARRCGAAVPAKDLGRRCMQQHSGALTVGACKGGEAAVVHTRGVASQGGCIQGGERGDKGGHTQPRARHLAGGDDPARRQAAHQRQRGRRAPQASNARCCEPTLPPSSPTPRSPSASCSSTRRRPASASAAGAGCAVMPASPSAAGVAAASASAAGAAGVLLAPSPSPSAPPTCGGGRG